MSLYCKIMLNHKIICEKLQKTYNANVLDLATKETRDLFVTTAKTAKEINIKKGNQTLLTLIDNYSKQNKTPVPQYIAGPKRLSLYWNSQYQLYIYLFGETHSSKTDCELYREKGQTPSNTMFVEDFLEQLISTTPAFLDIYLEIGEREIKKRPKRPFLTDDRIGNIWNKLNTCINLDTRHRQNCDLVRMHYLDIRLNSNKPLNDASYFIFTISKAIWIISKHDFTILR